MGSTETWRRAAQINYIHISKSETGAEVIEAQGLFLSSWLSDRLIVNPIVTKATSAQIIERIVYENLGAGAEVDRQFPRFEMMQTDDLGGDEVDYSHNLLVNAGQEIRDRAVADSLGYDIFVNEREKKYGFKLYRKNDLTQGNLEGNNPCVFSQSFDNVQEQEYTDSTENYKNVTYVTGQALEGETMPTAKIGTATGLERKEVYTDAAEIQREYEENGQQIAIPLAEYEKMLEDAGATNLESYKRAISFSSEIKTDANLKYRKDYDIGNRVTRIERRWGLKIDALITAIEEVTEKGKDGISVTFGDALPELIDKIRKVR